MYGSTGVAGVVVVTVPLEVGPALGPGDPLALGPDPDMVKVKGVRGGEPEGEGGSDESGEESECGLEGGLARRRRCGAGRSTGN